MRSYECQVESLGNAMIQPTMYFNLRHVPMFNGPYMIQTVTHNIDAGNFRTTFKGVRIPKVNLPKLDNQIASLNQNLLTNLVNQLQRQRQVEQISGNPQPNITTVGNTINAKATYTPKSSSTCYSSLSITYQRYTGVDAIKVQFNYSTVSNMLASLTTDTRVRAMVMYSIYLNGVFENQFVGYNYNLAGLPAGGYLYDNVNYGGLKTYFDGTYFCMDDGSGNIRPYISFYSLENFMRFMVDFYKNKVAVANSNLWSTQLSYVMVEMYIDYWPVARFGESGQNNKDRIQWVDNNISKTKALAVQADETITIMKKNNLL
jgi:hypothetical protein